VPFDTTRQLDGFWSNEPAAEFSARGMGQNTLMIELLPDMPAGTLGFRAEGGIHRDDHANVLVPELHKALAAGEKLRKAGVRPWAPGITANGCAPRS
jgi:hypothetical protein